MGFVMAHGAQVDLLGCPIIIHQYTFIQGEKNWGNHSQESLYHFVLYQHSILHFRFQWPLV